MDFILNYIFAWIGVALAIMLSAIYVLRIMNKNFFKGQNKWIFYWHNRLRQQHKTMGIALVAIGLIHGLYSSDKLWSFNLGTALWMVSILLGLNWMLRKTISQFKPWIHTHRYLTVLFLILIPIHILDVGGIQILDEAKVIFNDNFYTMHTNGYTLKPLNITSIGNQERDEESTQENAITPVVMDSDLRFENGVYNGSADAYGPNLQVQVIIENNVISQVEVTDHNEKKASFYSYPIAVIPDEIVTANTTDVDSISGATYTSIGIKNAVHNALKDVVIAGELPMVISLPTSRRH